MRKESGASHDLDEADKTRLFAIRDRRTGQLRILPAAHVMGGTIADEASDDIDLGFLAALGRGRRS